MYIVAAPVALYLISFAYCYILVLATVKREKDAYGQTLLMHRSIGVFTVVRGRNEILNRQTQIKLVYYIHRQTVRR